MITNGLEYEARSEDTFTIVADDPLSAQIQCDRTTNLGRGDWRTRVRTSSTLSADATTFYVENTLEAFEGDIPVFTKTWKSEIPRDLV
jgi:hypothetical protein